MTNGIGDQETKEEEKTFKNGTNIFVSLRYCRRKNNPLFISFFFKRDKQYTGKQQSLFLYSMKFFILPVDDPMFSYSRSKQHKIR